MTAVWTADSDVVTADSSIFTADGGGVGFVAPKAPIPQLQGLADLFHYWSSDLNSSNTGDLLTATGFDRSKQRILRRLLTNPGDYIWHPEYGGGLPQFIGQPINVGKITGVIRSQLALEPTVAKSPPAQIQVTSLASDVTAFAVSISYTNSVTKAAVVLSFSVTN